MENKQDVGKIIKVMRYELNLSQSAFAEKFHLSAHSVKNWEQNIRKPPEAILFLIQRVIELEKELSKH